MKRRQREEGAIPSREETLNEAGFRTFLRSSGRSESVADRCVHTAQQFARFVEEQRGGRQLDQAEAEDLEAFVAWVEAEPKATANAQLWALRYYFQFAGDKEMERLVSRLRRERVKTKPAPLVEFPGVDPEHLAALATAGIRNASQMLAAGRTPADRQALAERTGVPPNNILEMVKLCDLSRLRGVRGKRARLYLDAGIDTVAKMAGWEPEALRRMIVEFVERTGFDGVPVQPAEARATVAEAQRLSPVVDY